MAPLNVSPYASLLIDKILIKLLECSGFLLRYLPRVYLLIRGRRIALFLALC